MKEGKTIKKKVKREERFLVKPDKRKTIPFDAHPMFVPVMLLKTFAFWYVMYQRDPSR